MVLEQIVKYSGSLTQLNNKITSVKRTLTTNLTDNVNVYVKYYLQTELHGATLTSCSATLFAKLSNDVRHTVASQPLNINGTVFNASFYGNGVIFSKATDQYVGMMATPTGTQLEIRSGTKGLKVDSAGVSQYNPNGTAGVGAKIKQWDNAGLLCGYHVNVDGNFLTQFGVKDKSANTCIRTITGTYKLTHNIGHTDYVANVVVASSGSDFYNIAVKSANYVEVQTRNNSGGPANRPFMITFFGRM